MSFRHAGFTGWDNLDPSSGLNAPSTMKCTAYGSQTDGQSKGYSVCAYVQVSAACGNAALQTLAQKFPARLTPDCD